MRTTKKAYNSRTTNPAFYLIKYVNGEPLTVYVNGSF